MCTCIFVSFAIQGCCLTGAWAPGAPSIYPRATKISNRESNGRLKLMILKRPSSEKTAKFPVHFALWNDNVKRLIVGHRQKNISAYKGIHTALCLEIRFCDFHCRAVEVPRQKMASNAFNSLRKNFDNKTFSARNVRSLLHEVKTDKKSRSVEKQADFKLYVTSVVSACH